MVSDHLPERVWIRILGVHAFVMPYANHDEDNHAPNENIERTFHHRHQDRRGAAD